MRTVNIAELKDRLAFYLRMVRQGEPVLVRDRETIIARIEPAGPSAHEADERLAALERKGVVRRGLGGVGGELLSRRVRQRVDAVGALLREREEGR